MRKQSTKTEILRLKVFSRTQKKLRFLMKYTKWDYPIFAIFCEIFLRYILLRIQTSKRVPCGIIHRKLSFHSLMMLIIANLVTMKG